jgi:thiamine-phosphate pyrophosphorylase
MLEDKRALGVCVLSSRTSIPGRDHRAVLNAAIEGGAPVVQLRAPELTDVELLPLAAELAARCRAAGVLFVVNDRLDVAIESGADGVHLGQTDDPTGGRRRLGADRVLGVSVGDTAEIRAAELAGADYLGVTVWPTASKPNAVPHGLEGLRLLAGITPLPVVGIGGIFASNAESVLEAGATGIAVISAVASAPDPVEATRRLVDIVQRFRAREGVAP